MGTEEAIAAYQKDGSLTEGLLLANSSIRHPVKIEDANRYRQEFTKDGYSGYGMWEYMWVPKDGIPYEIVDTSVGLVFTICYTNTPIDNKVESLRAAANFLLAYADDCEKAAH